MWMVRRLRLTVLRCNGTSLGDQYRNLHSIPKRAGVSEEKNVCARRYLMGGLLQNDMREGT